MLDYAPIIIAGIVVLSVFFLVLKLFSNNSNTKKKPLKVQNKSSIIKDCNKRLSINPKDPEALLSLADLYYKEKDYDKAKKTYQILVDLCAAHSEINEYEVNLRLGICSLKTNEIDVAYRSLVVARTMDQDNFEINYNLGVIEYKMKNYEKAASLLLKANNLDKNDKNTYKYLGHTFFKLNKFKESSSYLLKAMQGGVEEDKESLYILGKCYNETGQSDNALKIFSHLRPDPIWGPRACLYSGLIHIKQRQYEQATMDLEIGLKHENISTDLSIELKYRLALSYINLSSLSKAINLLRDIQAYNPEYKDIIPLLRKYSELNSNRNLQVFLISPISEFISLCRKVTMEIFPNAKVKIEDISVNKSEYADILAEVHTKKWEDVILFRYIRTTGQIGELFLRDLQARIKEVHAGRGFCITAGTYTEGALGFVEARLIDLVEKDALLKILKKLD